jgi:hypothetical integral membrane protein (TIGR02206 family)
MLPVEVCAALTFIGAYAHFKRSQLAYEIIFFWTFALTLHSLITPTPADGFPSVEYFRYFFSHGILILNAFYVFLVLKVPLSFRALLRSFLALQVLVILAALSDWSMAQNFMFLVHKPAFPTSMDGMGPWPYYIGTLELTTLFSFALWWGIAKWIRKNASRQASVIA